MDTTNIPKEAVLTDDDAWLFGKSMKYWIELQKKAEKLDVVDYLMEISELRGKVSFYESRIEELNKFRQK
jgi:hypothetical protein